MIKLGFHYSECVEEGLPVALAQAVKEGVDTIQLFVGSTNPKDCYSMDAEFLASVGTAKTADFIKANGLKVYFHLQFAISLANDHPWKLKQSIHAINKAIAFANELGVKGVVIHPGSVPETRTAEEALVYIHKALAEIQIRSIMLESQSHSTVPRLLLENMACGGRQFGSVNNLLGVLHEPLDPKYIGVVIDVAHAYAAGHEMTPESLESILNGFGLWLGLVHFNNPSPKVKLGSHLDRHSQPITEGALPAELMPKLAKVILEGNTDAILEFSNNHAADISFLSGEVYA